MKALALALALLAAGTAVATAAGPVNTANQDVMFGYPSDWKGTPPSHHGGEQAGDSN